MLDANTAWSLVHTAAQNKQGQQYKSPKRGRHYRLAKVQSGKIFIDRLDGGEQDTLSEKQVRDAISRLNAAGGRFRRSKLIQTVAREVTLVYLHPHLRWSPDPSNHRENEWIEATVFGKLDSPSTAAF